jgi:hypothetical protein
MGLLAGSGGPVRAAESGASTVIDRTFIDAAFVDRPGGETPDLLTLALDESTFGLVHIALLRRETTWTIQAQVAADLSASFDGGTPWLIQLSAGSFEIIAGTNDQQTVVTHVRVAAGGLAVDPSIVVGLVTSDAGAADVNGDGAPDLVLAGYLGAGTTDCPPVALAAVSGQDATLAFLEPIELPGVKNNLRLAGAALGEWDNVPGIDLLANMYETCVSALDNVEPHHLTVIRLSDGAVVADHLTPVPEMLTASPWSSKPLVLDVDGDDRNEAVIATDAGLQIVDPSDGFRSVPIPGPRAVPLAARTSPDTPGRSVSWLESTGDAAGRFGSARVTRVGGRIHVDEPTIQPFPEGSASDSRDAALSLENAAFSQQPLFGPLGDIDADGFSPYR